MPTNRGYARRQIARTAMNIYFVEAGRSLYANKQRTLLALIGIIIGIGSVISLVSIGQIVTAEATRKFRELGTDLVRMAWRPDQNSRHLLRNPAQIQQLKNEPCVKNIAPYLRDNFESELDIELGILGSSESFAEVSKLQVVAGRFISDLDHNQPFVVLGSDVPQAFKWSGSPQSFIGEEMWVNGDLYTIIGILAPTNSMKSIHIKINQSLFIPISRSLKNERRFIDNGLARSEPDAETQACAEDIQHYFQLRFPGVQTKVITADSLIARMRDQTAMFNVLLAAIGSISLLVGGIGIMNIMLVSVSERKQEIGIRRALGAKRKDIRLQFLYESLLLSVVGGILGIGLGALITYIAAQYNHWEFFMSIGPMLIGAGVSAAIGVFFGLFPAHQAANLDPIAALRGD